MHGYTLDQTAFDALSTADWPVQLYGPSGQPVGVFYPPAFDRAAFEAQIDEDELDRAEAEGGGRPLRDILADLEKLT